jgi:maleate cis-trans isomerase
VFKRLQDVTSAHIAAAALRLVAAAPAVDGIYIPCNQWGAADAASLIEDKLGIPVVTGAHADHWEAFRTLGIDGRIDGQGRLMLTLSNEAENRENASRSARPTTAASRV